MVKLTDIDRQQLVMLLKDISELSDERSRRQMLELAGLGKLASMIDLSGSPFIAVSQIVNYLSNYGRVSYDHEALGLFLNVVKSVIGIEQQAFLDRLLIQYYLMTPIVTSPHPTEWRGKETLSDLHEKIIGENTLRQIAFLAEGIRVARAVAYIGVYMTTESWSGTGFLVAPDLLLTNNHVLPSKDLLPNAIFRFNYEDNFKGEAQTPREYWANPDKAIFHTNTDLDYTLVQLDGEPGKEWGWLPVQNVPISSNARVNIIQHPYGQPKQISLQNNFVGYVGGNVVQYVTSTAEGSSGSPVFNNSWDVVAVHHAGGNVREPTTQRRYFRNEGILIGKILENLPLNIRQVLMETGD
ncbi:MAG: trypsin-like peptidase domain-containing protein [Blastocatellales bacterium]